MEFLDGKKTKKIEHGGGLPTVMKNVIATDVVLEEIENKSNMFEKEKYLQVEDIQKRKIKGTSNNLVNIIVKSDEILVKTESERRLENILMNMDSFSNEVLKMYLYSPVRMTQQEVAEKLGVTHASISKVFKSDAFREAIGLIRMEQYMITNQIITQKVDSIVDKSLNELEKIIESDNKDFKLKAIKLLFEYRFKDVKDRVQDGAQILKNQVSPIQREKLTAI